MQTKVLCMGKMTFLKEMFKLYGSPWIIAYLLLIVCAAVLSIFHDLRWIIVALMIICIVAPMMIAFFYIYHGFKPITVINTLPHTISFNDDDMIAVLLSGKKNEESGEIEYSEISRQQFHYSDLKCYKPGVTSVILPFCGNDKGFIWLPITAFEEKDGFSIAMNKVIAAIHK